VVLTGGSDIPAYQRMSLVTVDLLQKIGFKVDAQMSDWGSVATRRQKQDPPSQGDSRIAFLDRQSTGNILIELAELPAAH
jgi:hypothetical protein